MDFVEKVVEFNRIGGTGGKFNARLVALYYGLIMEELSEGLEAAGDKETFLVMRKFLDAWSLRFKEGDFDKDMESIDRVETLDAFIDLSVVSLGGAAALGADVNGSCNEVMDSNLSKFVDVDGVLTAVKDANGKIMKAGGFWRPQLAKYLPAEE